MNAIGSRALSTLTTLVASLLVLSAAWADPLPGRDILKFRQVPLDGRLIPDATGQVRPYWGHDELSTAYGAITTAGNLPTVYQGRFMADDFADRFNTPVVHVKWWGSYLNNFLGNFPVEKFLISFEEDIPAPATGGFSRPGIPLLNQIVRKVPGPAGVFPGSGTYTERFISSGGPPLSEDLYEYNAELHLNKEFRQEPNKVYWLKIVALVDLPPGVPVPNPIEPPPTFLPRWGWHNRDYTVHNPLASTPMDLPPVIPGERVVGVIGPPPLGLPIWHFQDDAVSGRVIVDAAGPMGQIMPVIFQDDFRPERYLNEIDGPQPIGQFSKDLAFELYTVPEPATCALMLAGLAGVLVASRRTRKD